MSEYLSKKAVLEWLKEQFKTCGDDVTGCEALNSVMLKIVTGAFDAPDGEVQRLRVAIKKAISMWHNTCDFADPEDVIEKMIAYLNEALKPGRELDALVAEKDGRME